MPNDCNNSLTITGITTDQWQEIACTFEVRDPEDQQDFLKTFCPEPDYGVTPVAKTYPENSVQYARTEEEREQILKNEPTISEDSWWDWRIQNWGTKWDIYSCCNNWEAEQPSTEFSANFLTAWSPMNEECMRLLSMRFPGAILINYYEEEGNDFCGSTVAKDGVVRDFNASMNEYREPYTRTEFPDLDARLAEKDQDLDDFFWEECDLGMFSDFIRDAQDSRVQEMIREVKALTKNLNLSLV